MCLRLECLLVGFVDYGSSTSISHIASLALYLNHRAGGWKDLSHHIFRLFPTNVSVQGLIRRPKMWRCEIVNVSVMHATCRGSDTQRPIEDAESSSVESWIERKCDVYQSCLCLIDLLVFVLNNGREVASVFARLHVLLVRPNTSLLDLALRVPPRARSR